MAALIGLALLTATLSAQVEDGPTVKAGVAVHYDPGVFKSVLRVRQRQGLIPYGVGYEGLASTTECSNIGKTLKANLRSKLTGEWSVHRLLIVDCSDPGNGDRARHLKSGLVVEVDYQTARKAGFFGMGRTRAVVVIP